MMRFANYTLAGLFLQLATNTNAGPLEMPGPRAPRARLACTTAAITNKIPDILTAWSNQGWKWKVNITIDKAQSVQGIYPTTANNYGSSVVNLPPVCAVTVHVTNSTDTNLAASDYHLGLFFPTTWNQKFLAIGGGSFTGDINWVNMGEGPLWGFATMSTDTGHIGAGGDMAFATSQGKLYDWGYRAMHGSVVVGKALTAMFYGQAATWSYFHGCSTGGRQALREIQYDADSFDGAFVGAPAWDTVHLDPFVTHLALELKKGGGAFTQAQILQLRNEVINQCDGADGIVDKVISNPDACNFNITVLSCSIANPRPNCLSAGQAAAVVNVFYKDYRDQNGALFNNGYLKGGEEEWTASYGFFGSSTVMEGFDAEYLRKFLNHTNLKLDDFTDDLVVESARVDPGLTTAKYFDMRPFRDRAGGKKGKIIMYHGMGDGIIPTRSSLTFYNNTMAATGETLQTLPNWFRHFEVPGMMHCGFSNGQNAPWAIGGAGQAPLLLQFGVGDGHSVAGHAQSPAYDGLAALMQWVENGTAPAQIIATSYVLDTASQKYVVARTRPLCPYPQKAVALVQDPTQLNSDKNWKCQ